jgi:hypothetical protein
LMSVIASANQHYFNIISGLGLDLCGGQFSWLIPWQHPIVGQIPRTKPSRQSGRN